MRYSSLRVAVAALALVAVGLVPVYSHAQGFNKNTASIAAGHGLGSLMGSLNTTLGQHGITTGGLYGPYHFKLDKGLTNHLSLGVSASMMRDQWTVATDGAKVNGTISENTNQAALEIKRWSYSAVARVNYHALKNSKFDPYIGAGLGYRSTKWNVQSNAEEFEGLNRNIGNTPLAFEFGIGARYYIMSNFGVYAEYGGANGLQGGIIMNMPGNGGKKTSKPTGGSSGKTNTGKSDTSGMGGKMGKRK